MNAELKAKWIEALRSGKYERTASRLRTEMASIDGHGYCCLGVLCEISGGMSDDEWEKNRHSFNVKPIVEAGLYDPKNRSADSTAKVLADLNDFGSGGFNAIADYIEANIPANGTSPSASSERNS